MGLDIRYPIGLMFGIMHHRRQSRRTARSRI